MNTFRIIQILLFAVLGATLSAVGVTNDTLGFWVIIGLAICIQSLAQSREIVEGE